MRRRRRTVAWRLLALRAVAASGHVACDGCHDPDRLGGRVALGSGRCRVAFRVSVAGTSARNTPAPAQATTPPQATAPQAGYAGSDTCVTCHTDQEASVKGSKHGQALEPADAGGAAGLRELPRSRPGARGRRRQGPHPEVRRDEAGGGQRDVPRPATTAARMPAGRAASTRRATCPARPATASTARSPRPTSW